MSDFWGLSRRGKEAKGWIGEQGGWSRDQFKNMLERGQTVYDQQQARRNQYENNLWDAYNEGGDFLNPAFAARRGNLAGYGQNVRGTNQANNDLISSRIPQMADYARGVYHDLSQQTNDTYAGLRDDTAKLYGDLRGQVGSTYGKLIGDTETAYTDMRGQAADVYGDQQDRITDAYGASRQNLNMLKPSSEAAMAKTGRAFAPQYASTVMRLQQAGITPNDPQWQAALSRVDTSRSRALDDTLADRTQDWVSKSNQLNLGEAADVNQITGQGLNTDLTLNQRGGDIRRGLTTDQLGMDVSLGQEQGGIDRGLVTDNANIRRNLGVQSEGIQRDLGTQGLNLQMGENVRNLASQRDYMSQMNDEELMQAMTPWNIKQTLMDKTGQAAQQGLDNSMMYQNLALRFGDAAAQQMMQAYLMESQGAGWGTKLLTNAAIKAATFGLGGM